MDLSKLDSLSTDFLISLRDAAESAAKRCAEAGDIDKAAGCWVIFRVYSLAIEERCA